MAASKQVPRKEKMGSQGFRINFQINLAFLDVRLVITVSIEDMFLFFFKFKKFFLFLFCILLLRGGTLG